jgi:Ca2+-binding EF-hand superfamily protein
MTARQSQAVLEYFKWLDTREKGALDDIQFQAFLTVNCDGLSIKQMENIFEIFDLDGNGGVDFREVK